MGIAPQVRKNVMPGNGLHHSHWTLIVAKQIAQGRLGPMGGVESRRPGYQRTSCLVAVENRVDSNCIPWQQTYFKNAVAAHASAIRQLQTRFLPNAVAAHAF